MKTPFEPKIIGTNKRSFWNRLFRRKQSVSFFIPHDCTYERNGSTITITGKIKIGE